MTRVTYGVASSCFHAVRAMQDAARGSGMSQDVVDAVYRYFYVDDIKTGAASVEAAQALMWDLIGLMQESQLLIRKWASNSLSIINQLPEELHENADAFDVRSPQQEDQTLSKLSEFGGNLKMTTSSLPSCM